MGRHSVPRNGDFPEFEGILDTKNLALQLRSAFRHAGENLEVRRCKLRRIHYRPDRSCRLLLECELASATGQKARQLYFGRLWRREGPRFPWTPHEKRLTQPPLGPARLVLPKLRLLLQAYPNDPDLPGLAALADSSSMLRWLQAKPGRCGLPEDARLVSSQADLFKYVPGQRCGFLYELDWQDGGGRRRKHRVYAKAYRPAHAAVVVETLRQVESSRACESGVLRVPRVHAFDDSLGIVWQEFVPGTKLSKDETAQGLRRMAAAAGRSLAAFHTSSLRLGRGKDMTAQLKELRKARVALTRAYPEHSEVCSQITQKLLTLARTLPSMPVTPVHGSFKSSHMFEVDEGLVLIDFDGAGLGDPLYDVGRFLARVVAGGSHTAAEEETIRTTLLTFQKSYEQGVPWGWPEERVRWSTCAHLIGSQVYKSVKRANVERVAATLRIAEAWLPDDGTPGWTG